MEATIMNQKPVELTAFDKHKAKKNIAKVKISGFAREVFRFMCDRCNSKKKNNIMWMSISNIAKEIGINPRTGKVYTRQALQKAFKELVELGFMLKEERYDEAGSGRQTSNIYYLYETAFQFNDSAADPEEDVNTVCKKETVNNTSETTAFSEITVAAPANNSLPLEYKPKYKRLIDTNASINLSSRPVDSIVEEKFYILKNDDEYKRTLDQNIVSIVEKFYSLILKYDRKEFIINIDCYEDKVKSGIDSEHVKKCIKTLSYAQIKRVVVRLMTITLNSIKSIYSYILNMLYNMAIHENLDQISSLLVI